MNRKRLVITNDKEKESYLERQTKIRTEKNE